MTILIGEVSCDLHPQACYVRVNIPGGAGVPLSIKATLNDFARNSFTKGRVVAVRETNHTDRRRFKITRVYSLVNAAAENICTKIETESAEAFGKEQHMSTMSHDRIRFVIDDCYYNNPGKVNALRGVLEKAFTLGRSRSAQLMSNDYGGFYIICRPSQFARFLIYRNDAGIKNGFIDLQAKLFVPPPKLTALETLAKRVELSVHQVDRVLKAMGLGQHDIEAVLEDRCDEAPEVDVSQNGHGAF